MASSQRFSDEGLEDKLTLRKRSLDLRTDLHNHRYLVALAAHKGETCPRCGVVQGTPLHGFEEFYCIHLDNKITRQQREESKAISQEFAAIIADAFGPKEQEAWK